MRIDSCRIPLFLTLVGTLSFGNALLRADLMGPYAPDANTLFLYHFDETAGATATMNVGSKGGTSYSVQNDNTGFGNPTPPTVGDLLGAAGYATNAISFGSSAHFHTAGYLVGYDFNLNGAYEADVQGGPVSPDRFAMTNLNFGNGGQTPFTLEALIAPTNTAGAQQIICTDSYSGANRGFQFRINGGVLQLQMLDGAAFFAVTAPIPTTGFHAFTNGNWYHAAVTYDGAAVKLYWTRVDPTVTAANQIASQNAVISTGHGAVLAPLVFGNDNRGASGEKFSGRIDEIRISRIARGPGEMQFFSPAVTIVADPISQNVDYSEPVNFSVTAASPTPMSYQWRFGTSAIANATNSSYSIPAVSAADAGLYSVVVTNTAGYAATSSVVTLVVGAANFLSHRYSFNGDANDSIGTAHGTNFGNAVVTGGSLVLDGTADTYTQLPGGLLTGLNSVTVDFWATLGANTSAARVFDFGNSLTNFTGNLAGFNYLFFSPNLGGGHRVTLTPGDASFEQNAIGNGVLDGQTVHVTCVIDPPNQRMLLYTNGVLEVVNTNLTAPLSALNNVFSYIGKSMFAVDPYLNGSIDELRIYNGALSPITVQQNHQQGPNIVLSDGPVDFVIQPSNQNVPVGQTAIFTAAATGYLPIRYQWYKAGSPVLGATNATYSFPTVLGDNGASIQVFATNVIGTTTYSDASTVATISTFIPPTLAWLGAVSSDWDTASLNWTNIAGGPVTTYSAFASALFDSRGSSVPTVNLVEAVNPDVLTVNATTEYLITSFTATGSLVGQGRIVKQNSGVLIMDVTNNLTGGTLISAGTLQIGNGSTTGTPGAGAITNNGTLVFNRSDTVALPNNVSGSGALQQNGAGLSISGNNTYGGQTLVNGGVLFLLSSNALGATSGNTVVAAGAQIYITANVDVAAEPLSLNGSADGSGALRKGGAGATAFHGPVTLASDSTLGVDGDATLTLSNSVSGGSSLTKNGEGTLALSAVGSYTGGTVLSAGILQLNANNAAGRGNITADAGRIVLGPGVTLTNSVIFNAVSPGAALGAIMMNDGTNAPVATVSGPITFNADAATGGHFVGPIASGRLNVNGPVTLSGGTILSIRQGNVRFAGTGSSYSEVQVRANTTSLGANNALATTAVMDIGGNGSTTAPTLFDLNGFSQTLAGLKNAVTPENLAVVTNSSATTGTLTLEVGEGGFQSFGGSIAGNVAVRLNSGTQVLAGTNAYTGSTIVSGGTLQIIEPTLAANSTVIISNGAILQLDFAVTNKVTALVINGVSQPLGVYSASTSAPFIAGPGSLQVAASIASNPTNITVSVSGGNLTLTWPGSHLGWILQSQTNSLSTGLATNWFDVAGSSSVTQSVIGINPANPATFYRLRHP